MEENSENEGKEKVKPLLFEKSNQLLTRITNCCHFFDMSLNCCGDVIPVDSSPNDLESSFLLLFSFSNNLTASMTALLCCPCPYIKNSDVRPSLEYHPLIRLEWSQLNIKYDSKIKQSDRKLIGKVKKY